MRIAYVYDAVYPWEKGGVQKRIFELAWRLAKDHDVHLYGMQYWDGPSVIEHEGIVYHGVCEPRELYVDDRRSIPQALYFATAVARALLRDGNEYDVIDVSIFPYFPTLAASVCTLLPDTPLVTTWHEVWGSYWKEYLGRLAPFGDAVERLTARVPQYPIAVSGVTADRLTHIGPSRDSITVVPNGIDIDHIRSVSPAVDGFDVLFAGRLIKDKNIDLLLEAFDRVAIEHDVTLGVIGDGPELDRLRAQSQRLVASDRVTFLGFLEEYEDVLSHMHTAQVFVSPSTREGFGITYVEAMAADCTVIGADHPESAASEVIGEGGFLVGAGVDPLVDTLDRILGGERPPADPVAIARQYDWDVITERLATVYYRVAIDARTNPTTKVYDQYGCDRA